MNKIFKMLFAVYCHLVWLPVSLLSRLFGREEQAREWFIDTINNSAEVLTERGLLFDISHPRLEFRAKNFGAQEPDLIKWMMDKYGKDEIFFDIGANIGYFSLIAAKETGVMVYAFEPEALTLAALNKNIFLNDLSKRVVALPVAVSDRNVVSYLSMRNFLPGNAYNTFGSDLDFRGGAMNPAFRQGSIGLKLDALVADYQLPFPNHVKIDVDGNEPEVIRGMQNVLEARELKTICVELTLARKDHLDIIERLQAAGFTECAEYINREREAVGTRNYYFERSR